MSNEHIGRLEKIGLGKESTAGTMVAATDWIPKAEGKFMPIVEKARDQAAYGTIDELHESHTVKQMTEVELSASFREIYGGNFLLAAMGTETITHKMTMSSITGTFVVGETVTGGTSAATGVIKRIEGSTPDYMLVSISSGTFQTAEQITGGTSSATGTIAIDTALRTHLFERLNSNNHPTFTLYGKDDVADYRSGYCMLEQLELSLSVGGMLELSSSWKGKKEASTSSSPAFSTEENHFLAAHANLYLASALSGLNGASATSIESFRVTIQKNLEDYQAFGSDDIASIHNKQFKVFGEITALFNSETLKNLVKNSTKNAMRLELINTDATIGTAGNPHLMIELAQATFDTWSKDGGNDDLQRQTIGFEMEYSVDDAEGLIIWLRNTQTTAY